MKITNFIILLSLSSILLPVLLYITFEVLGFNTIPLFYLMLVILERRLPFEEQSKPILYASKMILLGIASFVLLYIVGQAMIPSVEFLFPYTPPPGTIDPNPGFIPGAPEPLRGIAIFLWNVSFIAIPMFIIYIILFAATSLLVTLVMRAKKREVSPRTFYVITAAITLALNLLFDFIFLRVTPM